MKLPFVTLVLFFRMVHTDVISVPRASNVTLQCNHNEPTVETIHWYYVPCNGMQSTQVAGYIVGIGPINVAGQWQNRTSILSSAGDLTISDLKLQDDGSYTCRYDTGLTGTPQLTGATYNITVTGMLNLNQYDLSYNRLILYV